jgi:hypothetical protein
MNMSLADRITKDIRRVVEELQCKELSCTEYLSRARSGITRWKINQAGGWAKLCKAAGARAKTTRRVTNQEYFERLRRAYRELGRLPTAYERSKYHLDAVTKRWGSWQAFVEEARKRRVIPGGEHRPSQPRHAQRATQSEAKTDEGQLISTRRVRQPHRAPAIPRHTGRRNPKWRQTDIIQFPYEPLEEQGVVALFSILCATGTIDWGILDITSSRSPDATCYDYQRQTEIAVEFEHTLRKSTWHHDIDEIDCVVCWENRWSDFPKDVIELKKLISQRDP